MKYVTDTISNNAPPLAYPIEMLPAVVGVNRCKIFAAIRAGELTARKVGRSTIVERDEVRRWLSTLPTRGRQPAAAAA
jgi:hypothetical protein